MNFVAFDPKNPKIAFAAGTGDVVRTADGGVTWKKVDFGKESPVHGRVVAIHPVSGEILLGTGYGGLFRSSDGGKTWNPAGDGLPEKARVDAIAWDPADARNVYVSASLKLGDPGSVWHSTDGGDTVEDIGRDLPFEQITALVMDPTNPNVLYAGSTHSGVFKSTDGGETWNEKSHGFQTSFRRIRALATAGPGTIFATTYGAVYRTTDDGKTWQRLRSGIDKGRDYMFVAAGGAEKPHAIVGADDDRMVRSADGGDTWTDPPLGAPLKCTAPDPANPKAFYLCAGSGVLYADESSSWRYVTKDYSGGFRALGVDPKNPQNMFGAGWQELHRTTNGGKKWGKWKPFDKVPGARPMEHRKVLAIEFDPKNAGTVYIATQEDGIFKSTDGGNSWTVTALTGETLTSFALDPSDPQRMAAGTPDKGVLLCTDGGTTWKPFADGLPDEEHSKKKETVSAVRFGSGSPSPVYAATDGGGVYRAR